jgi:hypothetical protein
LTDYWLALSSDGVTWNETRVAGPFNYATASFVGGLFLGDYMSLVTRGDQFIPFFGITSGGTVNRSDIAIAFVAPPASTLARADASARDDPMIYRAESKSAMPLAPALASKLDATVREAMQRRVPGWRSPAKPTSR